MNKKGYFLIAMFVLSTALCVLIFIRMSGFFVSSAAVANSAKQAAASVINDTNSSDEAFSNNKALAENLKKKNLFTAPKSESEHPVKNVDGILGDSVLIDGTWYKNGDTIKDAKIVSVEAAFVKIKWNGSEKIFTPINAVSAAAQISQNAEQKQDSSNSDTINIRSSSQIATRSSAPAANAENKTKAEDPFAWMGVQLTDSQKQKLTLVWNKLPDEFKERAKEEWNKMPAEVKNRALEQLEQIPIEQIPVEQIERQFNR